MKIAGYEIDTGQVTRDGLLAIARAIAGGVPAAEQSEALERFSPHLGRDLARGLCSAPAVRAILETAALLDLRPAIDDELADALCAGDPTAPSEAFATDHFRIRYQRAGTCAVSGRDEREGICMPGSDGPPVAWIDPGRAPSYVKRLAFWLETARTVYLGRFGIPDPSPRDPVHVCITCGTYGAASPGHLTVARDLENDMLCCVAVHELFHVFQYPYGASGPWGLALFEGGAVFAEDTIADGANRYLYLASQSEGVLRRPDRSLEFASYDSALLWHYMAEQWRQGAATQQTAAAFTTLYEHAAAGTCSIQDLEQATRRLFPGRGFARFVGEEDAADGAVNRETLLGNYALACYLKDVTTIADRRFSLRDNGEVVYFAHLMREPQTRPSPVSIGGSGIVSAAGKPVLFAAAVAECGHRYYELRVDPDVAAVDIAFRTGVELGPALFQVVRIDDRGHLVDIHRNRARVYRKRVHSSAASRIGRLVLVLTSTGLGGDFQISAQPAPASPDARITRRNCRPGTEYEVDPAETPWTSVSPDLWAEGDNGERRDFVTTGEDNRLMVRVRNQGPAPALGLCVDFEIQEGESGWAALRDGLGLAQVVRDARLPAETVGVWNVLVCPSATAIGNVAIRATLFVSGDPNTDNKVAVSEFERRVPG
jgi:hypothetical protein